MRRQGRGRPAARARSGGVTALRAGGSQQRQGPSVKLLLESAIRAHQAGRLAEAKALYEQILKHDADQPDALHLLGVLAQQVGRPDLAASLIRRALVRQPLAAAFHQNLGNALVALGQHDDAQASYRRALDLAPGDPATSLNLAELHRSRSRLIEAASLYQLVLQQAPDDLIARRGLMLAYSGQDRQVDVVRTALDGLKHCPDEPSLLRGIVEALQTVSPVPFMPAIRDVLLTACADETFDAQQLAGPLSEIIASVPEIHALIDAARAGQDPFATGVPLPTTLVEEPVVLAGLARLVICSPDVERILTTLRRFALQYAMAGAVPSLAAVPLPRPFVATLARAAFLVEYAWYVEPEEAALVTRLRDTLQRSLSALAPDRAATPAEIEDGLLLAALYDSLDTLPGAERLATLPQTPDPRADRGDRPGANDRGRPADPDADRRRSLAGGPGNVRTEPVPALAGRSIVRRRAAGRSFPPALPG